MTVNLNASSKTDRRNEDSTMDHASNQNEAGICSSCDREAEQADRSAISNGARSGMQTAGYGRSPENLLNQALTGGVGEGKVR